MSQTITRQRSFLHHSSGSHTPNPLPAYSQNVTPQSTTKMMARTQHSVVASSNELLSLNKLSKRSARWCVVNAILSVLCYSGLLRYGFSLAFGVDIFIFGYIEVALAILFLWNMATNLYFYCLPVLNKHNVVLSPKQKELLGISKEDERLFHIHDPTTTSSTIPPPSTTTSSLSKNSSNSPSPSTSYPLRRSLPRAISSSLLEYSPSSQYSTGQQISPTKRQFSPARNTTPHFNLSYSTTPLNTSRGMSFTSTPSPSVFLNNSQQAAHNQSLNSLSPSRRANSQDEELLDFERFDKFIQQEEQNDARLKRGSESPQKQSLWKYGRSVYDYIPPFSTYQLATRSQTPNVKDDDDAMESPFKQDEIWRKLGFNRYDVATWTENIRKWLSQTVLEPLVTEINTINKRLTHMGNPELHIGIAGISSLETVLSTKGHHFPSLTNVIAYLNVTSNQEYLVARVKELATGGCLRLYCHDGGGKFKGKPWNPDLPTDSQLLIHFLCSYMDTHLPSNPRYAEGKSFTGLHFLKSPTKPEEKKSALCIYQTQTQKPHLKVLVDDYVCELPKGRNNLFYAIAVFLYYAKQNFNGMLERVNLGMSGINVLWVLDKN